MCDLNGPFKLCSCDNDVNYSKPHWVLHRNAIVDNPIKEIAGVDIGGGLEITVGIVSNPNMVNMLDIIQERNILRRLNTINVFDFEYHPNENDELFIHEDEDDFIEFVFKKGKWRKVDHFGPLNFFMFEKESKGIIESQNSKLKEVYKKYLSVLNMEEMDITFCHRTSKKISEKVLIQLMESRIKEEN